MSEVPRVSRRGLFTLGAARVAEDVTTLLDDSPRPVDVPDPPGPDRHDWSERQAAARAQSRAASQWAPAATTMLDAVHPRGEGRLLAAGDGDALVAVAAARGGWAVTACDDHEPLVARGRQRCQAAGAEVRWLRADLDGLPFEDASFDCVVSCFSPMFCPGAQGALGELCRVVRPGGTVTFTAWKPSGMVGRLLLLAAEHDPIPRGIVAPVSWGREASVRPNLRAHCDLVEFEHRTLDLWFDSSEDAADHLHAAVSPLAAVPDQASFRDAMQVLVEELAEQGDAGATVLPVPYMLVRAVPRETGSGTGR